MSHKRRDKRKAAYLEQLGLGGGDALFAALDEDLVRLEHLARFALAVVRRLAREGDFDRVLILETNGVLATLSDERGVILGGDLEHLGSLVGLQRITSVQHRGNERVEPLTSLSICAKIRFLASSTFSFLPVIYK